MATLGNQERYLYLMGYFDGLFIIKFRKEESHCLANKGLDKGCFQAVLQLFFDVVLLVWDLFQADFSRFTVVLKINDTSGRLNYWYLA